MAHTGGETLLGKVIQDSMMRPVETSKKNLIYVAELPETKTSLKHQCEDLATFMCGLRRELGWGSLVRPLNSLLEKVLKCIK